MEDILVVHDIETTGLDKDKDYIIQYAAIKVDLKQNKIIDKINLFIKPDGPYEISIQAYIRHGIKPEFLQDKPVLSDVAQQIIDFIGDNAVLTYNGTSFDNPFIVHQLAKRGFNISFTNRHCYDSYLEERRRHGMKLDEVFARYTGKTMEDSSLTAHDAYSDVKATYGVFKYQYKEKAVEQEQVYGDDNFIQLKSFKGTLYPCFTTGKYRELPVESVLQMDRGYLEWCVSPSTNFTETTKNYIRTFLK